jgi:hypothetical protein
MTPIAIGQLASLRVRVMRSLIGYLARLDERCSRLRLSTNEDEKVLSRTIQKDVQELRSLVNSHVSHWTPTAVLADPSAYRTASDHLQQAMRKVVKLYH